MNLQDRINLIKEAIHKVQLASDLVQEALEGTNLTSHYEAYGQYGISQLLGNGNQYDSSLYSLKEELMEKQKENFEQEFVDKKSYSECGVCGKAKTDPEMELCTTCIGTNLKIKIINN
tara:strand:- start:7618 stop:7971 length:354 start_codon:yes stop_codon:yes gene_type:complete